MAVKLIVIEGLDGSGKATQTKMLVDALSARFVYCKQLSFPDYSDPSSTLVKMYLSGEFGKNPSDVNAYAASSFYAVDRYASFIRHWKADYDSGKLIISDRYTTSNAVHQTSKLPIIQWNSYLDWLYDYEFNLLKIPKPDLVIYLDMPPEISQKLIASRYQNNESKKDIHESNLKYLLECRNCALYVAEYLGWQVVSCAKNGQPLAIDEIAEKIMNIVSNIL